MISKTLPISDGAGHKSDVDKVEGFAEGPFFFYVVYFEADVRWDPSPVRRDLKLELVGTYMSGWVGLRSMPMTWLVSGFHGRIGKL